MKYPLNTFLHNIASWYGQISTHKVAKIQLLGKYPQNIFLHNIASGYWQISTHKVAKIQLLGTKIHYTKFQRT